MTNVKPTELNYDSYEMDKYDEDIVNSIPGHRELHAEIIKIVSKLKPNPKILELGTGTGLTTQVIAKNTKNPHFILTDFSKKMLDGAKRKLKGFDCEFILGDYSKIDLPKECDVIVSVIGFHHQGDEKDKVNMLKKIYDCLKQGGILILGDLMTYEDKELSALNDAHHYHFLVEKAKDGKTLKEWAYHHKYLNPLSSWENHIKWMKEIGFKPEIKFQKFNTFLILGKK